MSEDEVDFTYDSDEPSQSKGKAQYYADGQLIQTDEDPKGEVIVISDETQETYFEHYRRLEAEIPEREEQAAQAFKLLVDGFTGIVKSKGALQLFFGQDFELKVEEIVGEGAVDKWHCEAFEKSVHLMAERSGLKCTLSVEKKTDEA